MVKSNEGRKKKMVEVSAVCVCLYVEAKPSDEYFKLILRIHSTTVSTVSQAVSLYTRGVFDVFNYFVVFFLLQ